MFFMLVLLSIWKYGSLNCHISKWRNIEYNPYINTFIESGFKKETEVYAFYLIKVYFTL